MLIKILTIATSCITMSAFATDMVIPDGTYKVASPYCTATVTPDPVTDEWPSCENTYDCFSIRKIGRDNYWFSVQSVQTSYHYCTASGVAKLINGKFVFTDVSDFLEVDGVKDANAVSKKEHPKLKFYTQDGKISFEGNVFCGAGAYWNLVSFPVTARKTQKVFNCGK